jgi:hypothetical protein
VRFSQAFSLDKSQCELDFVDVFVDDDLLVFVDPFALSRRRDDWSRTAHETVVAFFQRIVDKIREGNEQEARDLLSFLREPSETHLGHSKGHAHGAGIGRLQADHLFEALSASSAVRTGFIQSIQDCELMVDDISHDKISDITTNVIRSHLAAYTKQQCDLLGVPTRTVALPPAYDPARAEWASAYADLPVHNDERLLLVPKAIVRTNPAYSADRYYRHHVLEFLQAEVLDGRTSLAKSLSYLVHEKRNGEKRVTKKSLADKFPISKAFLAKFSADNPQVLERYKETLKVRARSVHAPMTDEDEGLIAGAIGAALKDLPPGRDHASAYHKLMTGAVELLLFPHLIHPRVEWEIHEGRKRIDIVMANDSQNGVFWRIPNHRKIHAGIVVIECKNYSDDVANPEFDQLAGRFSDARGRLGLLMCRTFDDRALVIRRCRDTFTDGRGLVLPMNDEFVLRMLAHVEGGTRQEIDKLLSDLVAEVAD